MTQMTSSTNDVASIDQSTQYGCRGLNRHDEQTNEDQGRPRPTAPPKVLSRTLDQQLTHDAPAAGAQGDPDGGLARPVHRAREEQIGDVRARDQQHEGHCAISVWAISFSRVDAPFDRATRPARSDPVAVRVAGAIRPAMPRNSVSACAAAPQTAAANHLNPPRGTQSRFPGVSTIGTHGDAGPETHVLGMIPTMV
jgi:hypothetical protein